MSRSAWSSAISPQHPPIPTLGHWTGGLVASIIMLAGGTAWIARETMPDPLPEEEVVEQMVVALGAPAQRLEPPPPPPPEAEPPPPEPPPPTRPTERAEDAPPPAPPPEPRVYYPPENTGLKASSGFNPDPGPPSPPPAPPPRVETLSRTFIDISTREYVSRVEYPYEALRRRIEGQGSILVVIDRKGRVLSWELSQSTGSRILDREISRVAKQVEQLDPLPANYGPSTAKLLIPFTFVMSAPG